MTDKRNHERGLNSDFGDGRRLTFAGGDEPTRDESDEGGTDSGIVLDRPPRHLLIYVTMHRKDTYPGAKLKRLRESLGMTLRDVEKRSEEMALGKDNPYYALSRGWLADIENGVHVPGIFKLYALSAIYSRSWVYLNSLFSLRMSDLAKDQAIYGVPRTRLLPKHEDDPETVILPLRFRHEQHLAETNLLAK